LQAKVKRIQFIGGNHNEQHGTSSFRL